MKLTVKNLGPIKEGTFDLSKDLIVFTGDNNTGKTYAAGLVYMLSQRLVKSIFIDKSYPGRFDNRTIKIDFLVNCVIEILSKCDPIKNNLNIDIALPDDQVIFDCSIKMSSEYIYDIILEIASHSIELFGTNNITATFKIDSESIMTEVMARENVDELTYIHIWHFFVSRIFYRLIGSMNYYVAERGAITMFSQDILNNRVTRIGDSAIGKSDMRDLPISLRNSIVEANRFNSRDELSTKTENTVQLIHNIENNIVDGKITYLKDDKKVQQLENGIMLPIEGTSSSFKSSSNIVYSLNQLSGEELLIIDEPELNLHPNRQSAFGRIMGQAVGQGSRFLITTHSDYIIREINILCQMFQNRDKLNLANFPEYTEDMLIDPKRVGMYYFDKTDGKVKELMFDKETGFIIPSMDAEIERQNDTINKIYTYAFD